MSKYYLLNRSTLLFLCCFVAMSFFININVLACINYQGPDGVCVEQIQNNNYRFTIDYPGYSEKDLVFWITPDGHWQYGHQIERYLETNSYDFGTAHVVRKNDTDFGIATYPIPPFDVTDTSNGINPIVEGGALVLNSSWSASYDQWVYTIITYTNTTESVITNGTLKLSYENNVGYSFNQTNTVIPYNWANYLGSNNSGNLDILNWSFSDLHPGEQRHIYVAFEVAPNAQSSCTMTAEMNYGHGIKIPAELKLETKNYPHDPNFVRIDKPYGSEYNFYRYCSVYSEILDYTVGFQNEGAGIAKDVVLKIDINQTGYQLGTLTLTESSHLGNITNFTYNPNTGTIIVVFQNIKLPGLDDPFQVRSFQETTGYVSFSLKTKCQIDKQLPTNANIFFYAIDGTQMSPVQTNTVVASPGGEGNYCITCTPTDAPILVALEANEEKTGKRNLEKEITHTHISMSPNPCSDFFVLNYQLTESYQSVRISIVDITGKQRKELFSNDHMPKGEHRMMADIVDLESGMYIVNIQIGGQNESHKLLKW
ncbi:MAG: T9SS type A sorting domain-containing protein [Chitinophagales bacterium]